MGNFLFHLIELVFFMSSVKGILGRKVGIFLSVTEVFLAFSVLSERHTGKSRAELKGMVWVLFWKQLKTMWPTANNLQDTHKNNLKGFEMDT